MGVLLDKHMQHTRTHAHTHTYHAPWCVNILTTACAEGFLFAATYTYRDLRRVVCEANRITVQNSEIAACEAWRQWRQHTPGMVGHDEVKGGGLVADQPCYPAWRANRLQEGRQRVGALAVELPHSLHAEVERLVQAFGRV